METDAQSPLNRFISRLTELVDSRQSEAELLPHVGEAMKELISTDGWLGPDLAKAHPQYYQQYLLHADPDDRFSVVSFVWGPGQQTPIHNHTVWGVIGMLRGSELGQSFEIDDTGKPVPVGEEATLKPGDIEFVSPSIGDVHRVRNAYDDRTSISIHVYGGNIGKIKRSVFPADGGTPKPFISGYSNAG